MTDLARLGIEVDSRDVKTGVAELDKLTAAGAKAEKAVDKLGDTSVSAGRQIKGAGAAASEMAREAQRAAGAIEGTGKAGGLASHHMQNLTFQVNDLSQQLIAAANSSAPLKGSLMALMQQGTQISQIASQAGTSVGGMAAQFVAANPIILGIAAAGGAVAAAFGVMTAEINKTSAVTVTFGDTALGTMDAIAAYAKGELSDAFEAMGTSGEDAWKATVNATKWALNYMINSAVAAPKAMIASFRLIPAALGDIFYSGVNSVIGAINRLLERSVQAVNFFARQANKLLPADMQLGSMDTPSIGGVDNPYAGGLNKMMGAVAISMRDSWNSDTLGDAAELISPYAQARARERLKKDAKKAGGEAGKAGGKEAADEWEKAFLEGTGKFDPGIAQRFADIRAQTESDLYDIRQASKATWDQTYDGLNAAHAGSVAFNEELRLTIDYLDRIGGFGTTLGDIGAVFYGLKTGDFSGIGGPLGAVAETFQKAFPDFSEKIVTGFDKVLKSVFGANGSFTNLLQGAGTGTAMGSLLFGNNQGAQIGGAIGGAAGSIFGPIGNIVGSIIGSTIGKLFGGGAKYGSAVVTANGVKIGGNNDNSKGAASGAGDAVSNAIASIAQALGGGVGNYAVSIGETDGKWRISTSGRTGELKSKYSDVQVFGKGDAAASAALKAAIADAIKDGAITGVSESVKRLISTGTDIDKQVQKAQLFQNVFKELKAATNPMGAALDDLATQFDALRKIFDEAGASAQEYADLEQLLGIKRQEAIDAARSAKVEKITDQFELQIRALELMGKGEQALAASRLFELASVKESLQPLKQWIYQLEDARAIIDQFGPLGDDLRAYRKELVGTSSVASYGAARALFASTAASAAMGDAAALGNLRGVSQSYLDSAKANARSSLDYKRAYGQVLAAVDQGIFAADTKVDYAQAQIDAINNSANILERMRAEMAELQGQIASNTAYMANLWKRFDGEGLLIRNDSDTPIQVEVSA